MLHRGGAGSVLSLFLSLKALGAAFRIQGVNLTSNLCGSEEWGQERSGEQVGLIGNISPAYMKSQQV